MKPLLLLPFLLFIFALNPIHTEFNNFSNKLNKKTDIAKDWEIMKLPNGFVPSSVAFGSNGEIVLLGNDIRVSKDNGKTWKIISEGKGFDRCTLDGGKTFDKECNTKRNKPKRIQFDGDVNYISDIRNPVLADDGRLYLSTFYEHHGALWSIPIEKKDDLWFGLHFSATSSEPSGMQFWTTDNFITLDKQVFVSAGSRKEHFWLTTKNNGNTWHRAKFFDSPTNQMFVNENQGLKIKDKKVERTLNNGKTWKILSTNNMPNKAFNNDFVDDKVGFAVGQNGLLAKTIDGGQNWIKIKTDYNQTFYGVAALDKNNAWAVGENGLVLETIDGGETWKTIDLAIVKEMFSTLYDNALKVDKFHRTVWIIHDQKIYRKKVT